MQKKFKSIDEEERETLDETDLFEAPWMTTLEVGVEAHFELDRTQTWPVEFDPPESWGIKGTANQVESVMKNIVIAETGEQIDENGIHLVPFWACPALKAELKRSKAKKWVKLAYYREAEEEIREDASGTRTVTLNTANFKILTS